MTADCGTLDCFSRRSSTVGLGLSLSRRARNCEKSARPGVAGKLDHLAQRTVKRTSRRYNVANLVEEQAAAGFLFSDLSQTVDVSSAPPLSTHCELDPDRQATSTTSLHGTALHGPCSSLSVTCVFEAPPGAPDGCNVMTSLQSDFCRRPALDHVHGNQAHRLHQETRALWTAPRDHSRLGFSQLVDREKTSSVTP